MTLSGIFGDLQRSGIKLGHELNHLVDNFFSKQTLLVQDTLPETNSSHLKRWLPKRKGSGFVSLSYMDETGLAFG